MNKKGFTLVELLAVIALVAILSGIAIPNIISTVNNSKKSTFLMDAKRMVSKAEYLLALNKSDRDNAATSGKIYKFVELNEKGEFQKDADDGEFDPSSFVLVKNSNNTKLYCICVIGSKRKITGSNGTCNASSISRPEDIENQTVCLHSTSLTGIDKVKDK